MFLTFSLKVNAWGCNDGPGLLPLASKDSSKKFNQMLLNAGVSLGFGRIDISSG